MPSSFPSMDPYLEERSIWPDLHQRIITYIADEIQLVVQPKYLARIGERIEITGINSGYIPDIMVVEPPKSGQGHQVSAGELVADEPQMVGYLDEERTVPYIEIIDVSHPFVQKLSF